MTASSWHLKCATDAYLFGFYREIERQQKAGEDHDQDKAVRAGRSVEHAIEKIVGPWLEPGEAGNG